MTDRPEYIRFGDINFGEPVVTDKGLACYYKQGHKKTVLVIDELIGFFQETKANANLDILRKI